MAHYIDADRLKEAVEKKYNSNDTVGDRWDLGYDTACEQILEIIDSLQQEQPELPNIERAEYYYRKGVYEGLSQGRADALKILEEYMKRKADPVIVIKQQEQPEVDLEREIDLEWKKCNPTDEGMGLESANIVNEQFDYIAYHFYELGLNARKED